MDHALYVAMTGAAETLKAQTVNAQNLANINTPGFRAVLANATAAPIDGPGWESRVNTELADQGFDATPGMVQQTGRNLDVAVTDPNGWLAVQAPDGSTAYTRAGNLQLTPYGQLTTASGLPVMGDGGPISLPPFSSLTIAADGTITVVPQGAGPEAPATVGRLQVVAIKPEQLARGSDGLMHARADASPEPIAGNSLAVGALESSNVSPADVMVRMIDLARQFELQVKAMHTVDDNAKASASLMRMG